MSTKISESAVLSKLQIFSKTKSADSQSFDAPNFQIVIENVEVRGKIRIAKKVKCVGGSTSTYTVPWVLNDQSDCCMRCDQKFGTFTWRHHCRRCGFLVCSNCSPNTIAYQYLSVANPVRACNDCWRAHHSRNNRSSKSGRSEEDTPEEEPEPLLTRVPSWVQSVAERNSDVSPPKRISETIRRVSETPPDTCTSPGNSNSNRTSRISIGSEVSPRPSTSGPVTIPSIPEEEVPVVVESKYDTEKTSTASQHDIPLSPPSLKSCQAETESISTNTISSTVSGDVISTAEDLTAVEGGEEAMKEKAGRSTGKKNRKRGKKN